MAQKALVHKQFNSPLGLYSDNNIKETLNRELKTLSNGTMGWVVVGLHSKSYSAFLYKYNTTTTRTEAHWKHIPADAK